MSQAVALLDTPSEPAQSAEILDLVLLAGQLLLESGAEAERIEHTIVVCGQGLGCSWTEVLVTYNALIVSHEHAGHTLTKIRRTRHKGVNVALIENVSHLTHRTEERRLDIAGFRAELARVQNAPRNYGLLTTALTAGVGCGAFCRIFAGDWGAFAATVVGASLGTWGRQLALRQRVNAYLSVTFAAALAACVVTGLHRAVPQLIGTPAAALSAVVLMLVPGVAFVNAVGDAVKGHISVALARALDSALTILFAALGVLLASTLVYRILP